MSIRAEMRAAAIALLRRPQVSRRRCFLCDLRGNHNECAVPSGRPASFAIPVRSRARAGRGPIAARRAGAGRAGRAKAARLLCRTSRWHGRPADACRNRAFQKQSGFHGVAEPGLELLAALRSADRFDLAPVATEVGAAPSQTDPPSRPGVENTPPRAIPDSTVAAVQDALARAAYGPLVADGVAGPATRDAVMRFQRDHDLPVTGEITDALVVELRAAGALGGV